MKVSVRIMVEPGRETLASPLPGEARVQFTPRSACVNADLPVKETGGGKKKYVLESLEGLQEVTVMAWRAMEGFGTEAHLPAEMFPSLAGLIGQQGDWMNSNTVSVRVTEAEERIALAAYEAAKAGKELSLATIAREEEAQKWANAQEEYNPMGTMHGDAWSD